MISASDSDTWNQPEIPYAPFILLIMYLKVKDMSFEIDDTKDNERLFTQHRTYTSQEIDKDATINIIKATIIT